MTFSSEVLSQALGGDQWLARINPPHKEQTLHYQLLSNTKVPNPTAKESLGFGVTVTKQQKLLQTTWVHHFGRISCQKIWLTILGSHTIALLIW